jgi:hypothetical protein
VSHYIKQSAQKKAHIFFIHYHTTLQKHVSRGGGVARTTAMMEVNEKYKVGVISSGKLFIKKLMQISQLV